MRAGEEITGVGAVRHQVLVWRCCRVWAELLELRRRTPPLPGGWYPGLPAALLEPLRVELCNIAKCADGDREGALLVGDVLESCDFEQEGGHDTPVTAYWRRHMHGARESAP